MNSRNTFRLSWLLDSSLIHGKTVTAVLSHWIWICLENSIWSSQKMSSCWLQQKFDQLESWLQRGSSWIYIDLLDLLPGCRNAAVQSSSFQLWSITSGWCSGQLWLQGKLITEQDQTPKINNPVMFGLLYSKWRSLSTAESSAVFVLQDAERLELCWRRRTRTPGFARSLD